MSVLKKRFIFYYIQIKYFAQKGYCLFNAGLKIEYILKKNERALKMGFCI